MAKKISDGNESRSNELIELIDQLREYEVPDVLILGLGRMQATPDLVTPEKREPLLTALSQHLLDRLRKVSAIETDPDGATVRSEGIMPRSVIAATAMEIFDAANFESQTAPILREVFVELLNIKKNRSGTSRKAQARHTAEILLALIPNMTNRDLAQRLGVSHITIAKWLSDSVFKESVKINLQEMADPDSLEIMKNAVHLHFADRKEHLPELD
jgi:hypothetical protein